MNTQNDASDREPSDSGNQAVLPNLRAARDAIASLPELRDLIGYDTFTGAITRMRPSAWRSSKGQWDREDDLRVTLLLQRNGLNAHLSTVQHAVFLAAMDNQFDSLVQSMDQLSWDGVSRLEEWLCAYFGSPNTAYVRCIGPKILISAVARAYQPGCKVDTVPIFRGEQGIGKSRGVEILAGAEKFTDQLPDLHTKDACIQLRGKHIIELSELAPLKSARQNEMKSFISRKTDTYRAPYATLTTNHPRRVVFFGTTNESEYLTDPTGARRFWDVECNFVDCEALARDRDQLWAEAVHAFKAGTPWHLTDDEEAIAAAEQSLRYVQDPWANYIDAYARQHEKLLTQDILENAIRLNPAQIDQRARRRVNDHLRRSGWTESKSGGNRVWRRPSFLSPQANAAITAEPVIGWVPANDAQAA